MLDAEEHMPCRMLSEFIFVKEIQAFAIEINLRLSGCWSILIT